MKFSQYAPTATPPVPASTLGNLTSSANTTSATAVSTGRGLSINPTATGNIVVLANLTGIRNNTLNAVSTVALYVNTTGIPSNGTSVGSDTLIFQIQPAEPVANQNILGSLQGFSTGLTVGTTYYYYLGFAIVTAGTTVTILFGTRAFMMAFELAAS